MSVTTQSVARNDSPTAALSDVLPAGVGPASPAQAAVTATHNQLARQTTAQPLPPRNPSLIAPILSYPDV